MNAVPAAPMTAVQATEILDTLADVNRQLAALRAQAAITVQGVAVLLEARLAEEMARRQEPHLRLVR
jgi:hypothetical protein